MVMCRLIIALAWAMARKQAMMRLMDATLVAGATIDNVAEWCRVNGVNPRTFYRHQRRIQAEGSWQPRSRRPKTCPGATPPGVAAEIVRLRKELAPDNGADAIIAALGPVAAAQDWAGRGWRVPVRATINRILDRHGLLAKNPAKRPRSSWRRFAYARPRDCYQLDGTDYGLADGSRCVAIDVIDDCSRVWVASQVAAAETIDAAIAAFDAAVTEWGAPGLALADNGTAFAHPHRTQDKTLTSRFSRTLATRHGTRVIHSSPYHPQTCGKVERLHQTAAKLLQHRWPDPATSITELQHRLDQVRHHYNTRRRHGSLDTTPQAFWQHAKAHGGPGDLPRQDDATIHLITVMPNGTAILGSHILSVGRAHAGATITLLRNGGHVTAYHPDGEVLGYLTLNETKRYQGKLTPAA
jgi:putative transposase